MFFSDRLNSKSIWFWILFGSISLGGIGLCVRYFSQAFPLVNIDLTMNRGQALGVARQLAKELQIGPDNYQQAAIFHTDELTKIYVEFDAGGTQKFREILKSHVYEPYVWQVRHCVQGSGHEAVFIFTPKGEPYGFVEVVPEHVAGAALSVQEAQILAQTVAVQQWGIRLDEYKHIDSSQEIKLSQRVDHVFTYERINERAGEATYRLQLIVRGDKVAGVIHFAKIPEEFVARYTELRSANKGVALAAMALYFLIYLMGCCGFGLVFLSRRHSVMWMPAFFAAIIISTLNFLANLNQIPLIWMHYDTALSTHQFLIKNLVNYGIVWLGSVVALWGILAAAEGLTRLAFDNHPQFWKLWNKQVASSDALLGRTIGGYLLVGLLFAFVVILYTFSLRYFGWWIPSDHLINPNILATYFPWLNPIVSSLQAGFVEECVFRALPLAAAALLGNRFGKRTWWIAGAIILQALVFGAAHANYPTLPAYARLVELVIPSFMFAGVYLVYGLLPSILAHVMFDLVWFSIPLFISDAAGSSINQALVIISALIPLIIVLFAILRRGGVYKLSEEYRNKMWRLVSKVQQSRIPTCVAAYQGVMPKFNYYILVFIGLAGGALYLVNIKTREKDVPKLAVSRTQAIGLARTAWGERGIQLDEWRALSAVQSSVDAAAKLQHKFVWEHGGKSVYRDLIHSYLMPPYWSVRFVRFDKPVPERIEEFGVTIVDQGVIRRLAHALPETTEGAQLDEHMARNLAHQELRLSYQLDPATLEEISAHSKQCPLRRDWTFVFADKQAYEQHDGQARISVVVQGDKIADSARFIHIPDEWIRNQRSVQETRGIIGVICFVVALAALFGLFYIIKGVVYSLKSVIFLAGLILVAAAVNSANSFSQIIAAFNMSEPYFLQMIFTSGIFVLVGIFTSLVGSFFIVLSVASGCRNYLKISWTELIFSGIALAFGLMGLMALNDWVFPLPMPVWGDYQYLAYALPKIGVIIDYGMTYMWSISFVLLLYNGLAIVQQRFSMRDISLILWCMVFGIVATGIVSSSELLYVVLMQGAVAGLMFYGTYWLVVRYDVRVVPVMTFCVLLMRAVSANKLNAVPISWLVPSLLVIAALCCAWIWALNYRPQTNE